jgi:penicillin-binding protein activator
MAFQKKSCFGLTLFLGCVLVMTGCVTPAGRDAGGKSARYEDPAASEMISGVGIESRDVIKMTNQMMRDILADPTFRRPKKPPRVVIDAAYFKNEGSTRINKNLITDRLRTELNKAAKGKMIFVRREQLKMMLDEKGLAQAGITDDDGSMADALLAGADYRLAGRIASMDSVDPKTGTFSRYHQILFEMIALKSGTIAWSGSYNFKKSGQEDVIYR